MTLLIEQAYSFLLPPALYVWSLLPGWAVWVPFLFCLGVLGVFVTTLLHLAEKDRQPEPLICDKCGLRVRCCKCDAWGWSRG